MIVLFREKYLQLAIFGSSYHIPLSQEPAAFVYLKDPLKEEQIKKIRKKLKMKRWEENPNTTTEISDDILEHIDIYQKSDKAS